MSTKNTTTTKATAAIRNKYRGSLTIMSDGEAHFIPNRETGVSRYELIHKRGNDKIEKVGEKGERIKMTIYVKTDAPNPFADLMDSAEKLLSDMALVYAVRPRRRLLIAVPMTNGRNRETDMNDTIC